MSKLSKEDILKLARLARLHLEEDEVAQFAAEISGILEYVEQLQQVDLEGLEPTYQVTGLKNVMRPDEEWDYGPTPDDLLKNAPEIENHQFKARRMIA